MPLASPEISERFFRLQLFVFTANFRITFSDRYCRDVNIVVSSFRTRIEIPKRLERNVNTDRNGIISTTAINGLLILTATRVFNSLAGTTDCSCGAADRVSRVVRRIGNT